MAEPPRVALTLARVVAVGFALTMAGCLVYRAQKEAAPADVAPPEELEAAEAIDVDPSAATGVEQSEPLESGSDDDGMLHSSKSLSGVMMSAEDAALLLGSKSAPIQVIAPAAPKSDAGMLSSSKFLVITRPADAKTDDDPDTDSVQHDVDDTDSPDADT